MKSKSEGWLARLRSDAARRLSALVLLSVGTALLTVDYVRVIAPQVAVGEVAARDIRASSSFQYIDWEQSLERERLAEAAVQAVYDFDAHLAARLQARIRQAFAQARAQHAERLAAAQAQAAGGPKALLQPADVSPEALTEISRGFLQALELPLEPADLQQIADQRWSKAVEDQAVDLVGRGAGGYIVADRTLLPHGSPPLSVVRIFQDARDEIRLDDYGQIKTPAEVRQLLSLHLIESGAPDEPAARAALAIARAAVRPNFSYNQLLTEDRRKDKRAGVSEVVIHVKRGTTLVREGDVVTQQQVDMLRALQESGGGYNFVGVVFALISFVALLYGSLYSFGSGFIRKFSTKPADLEAGALLALLVTVISRLVVEVSAPLASLIGLGLAPSALWYAVPFAGGAMLVRILVNSETALLWILGTSAVQGLLMDQQVLSMLFFALSGVTAAGGIAHTKERVNVLRAGVLTGLVNAASALLIRLVQVHLGETAALASTQPLWDMGFAFCGGLLSAFLVLGLVPIFELFGFVTDFKLLELANLNHPLLRQLMLRAPGTYHHSMTVASLSEAAAEAIGAHALRTRVACYFHDIGKALQPQYFIENQRGGPNPHDRLKPHQSARVIVNHVVDGAAIARQHQLPQAVLDAILMHHGTSLVKYFYVKALEQAAPGETVSEADFRYPGIRPNTREAGIIFLADRVEAACRTLKVPSSDSYRSMIQKLVNDAVTDGQLEECPLTLKELYTIIDVFTDTLLGIHHHRIEYPLFPAGTKVEASGGGIGVITIETPNPLAAPARPTDLKEH